MCCLPCLEGNHPKNQFQSLKICKEFCGLPKSLASYVHIVLAVLAITFLERLTTPMIYQLLNSHFVRRVVMCCLAGGSGGGGGSKRQHLAVAHERGKITILQLSALLKQADSSQKKLTLTRLASAPVPFTVHSLLIKIIKQMFYATERQKNHTRWRFQAVT